MFGCKDQYKKLKQNGEDLSCVKDYDIKEQGMTK